MVNFSIKIKIIIFTSFLSMLLLVFLAFFMIQTKRIDSNILMRDQINSMTQLIYGLTKRMVWIAEYDELNKEVKKLLKLNEALVYLRFKDEKGEYVTDEIKIDEGRKVFFIDQDLTHEERKIGSFKVGWTLEIINNQVKKSTYSIILSILLLQALLSSGLFFFDRISH